MRAAVQACTGHQVGGTDRGGGVTYRPKQDTRWVGGHEGNVAGMKV